MIIGSALGRLFDGLTVDLTIEGNSFTRNIQYHYGDQKELNKWVLDRDLNSSPKYPLLWYVVTPCYDEVDYKRVRTRLIILQSTQIDWFNTTRSVKSYDEIIEPVWQKVKRTIELNDYISVIGDIPRKYLIKDEPNYGVKTNDIRMGQNDFTSKSTNSDEQITLDVVDGRIIELEFRIKTDCI